MADLKYVTYCGLYCKLCSVVGRMPQLAKAMQDTMKKDHRFLQEALRKGDLDSLPQGFKSLWLWLESQANPGDKRCRKGCGAPDCAIRKCAQEKGYEVCVYCDDYPCAHLQWLIDQDPTIVADGKMLKKMGIDAWIEEQELRCQKGVCYSDIRYDASD